ncbi:hypothetical protein [Bacillus sp. AFS040349]|uniref:hypothetical protein n=1 Tax=Bacillus sp. AFS040349 TaxID=2033502 RepID=UPI000BFCDE6E|nr:hypothetical protein [Bacillus sp. AFS040349]PGT83279.1 hypothetical protein COD11_13165 [Bacillus sp. AFS040349]
MHCTHEEIETMVSNNNYERTVTDQLTQLIEIIESQKTNKITLVPSIDLTAGEDKVWAGVKVFVEENEIDRVTTFEGNGVYSDKNIDNLYTEYLVSFYVKNSLKRRFANLSINVVF